MLNELHDQDEERAMLEAELSRLERCIAGVAADMMAEGEARRIATLIKPDVSDVDDAVPF